jgi:uncharacterized protein YbjT (DUF2867 family)
MELEAKGVEIRIGDATYPVDDLVPLLEGIDVVISAIDAGHQTAQLNLADASKKAGVKRFVPCAFITVAPPGGVMDLRDQVCSSLASLYLHFSSRQDGSNCSSKI